MANKSDKKNKYQRQFIKETQINENGYPLFQRRSRQDGGSTTTIEIGSVYCGIRGSHRLSSR